MAGHSAWCRLRKTCLHSRPSTPWSRRDQKDVDGRGKPGHDATERVESMQDLMKGKRGLIMGIANDHSIAWGVAKTLAAQGADLAFTYQGDALAKRIRPLA